MTGRQSTHDKLFWTTIQLNPLRLRRHGYRPSKDYAAPPALFLNHTSIGVGHKFKLDKKVPFIIQNKYRAEKKFLQILLSSTQAGPGRKVKQEQE